MNVFRFCLGFLKKASFIWIFSVFYQENSKVFMQEIFSEEELSLIKSQKVPEHVAIIMDGNRRWAIKNGLSKFSGHKKGAENLERILTAASHLNIKALTVYAFSTENWARSKKEVSTLWKLFEEYLKKYLKTFQKKSIKIKVIGDISKCPVFLQKKIKTTIEKTGQGQKITLILAINYGGRDEILRSLKKMLYDYDKNKFKKEDLTEKMMAEYLDTAGVKDPELVIRTSGELRLSNFLLWQLSYSELYVTETFWPDFSPQELFKAIIGFQERQRRFGGF